MSGKSDNELIEKFVELHPVRAVGGGSMDSLGEEGKYRASVELLNIASFI